MTIEEAEKVRRWMVLEDMLAEDEAARMAQLSPEALEAELDADGYDALPFPTFEEMLARVEERARERADSSGASSARANRMHSGWAPSARKRRTSRTPWLAAGALTAAAAAIAAAVALVLPRSPKTDAPLVTRDDEVDTRHQIGVRLRDEATKACAEQLWGLCNDKLEAAAQVDPAGDGAPAVEALREDIRVHSSFPPDFSPKGPPRPKKR